MKSNPITMQRHTRAICQRCLMAESEEGQALAEVALSQERDAESLLEQAKDDETSGLRRMASRMSRERLEEERQQVIEEAEKKVGRPDIRQQIEEQIEELGYQAEEEINRDDLQGCLDSFIKDGYLDEQGGEIRVTARGARKLGSHLLGVIMKQLVARATGAHHSRRADFGSQLFSSTRKYELGDDCAPHPTTTSASSPKGSACVMESGPGAYCTHSCKSAADCADLRREGFVAKCTAEMCTLTKS